MKKYFYIYFVIYSISKFLQQKNKIFLFNFLYDAFFMNNSKGKTDLENIDSYKQIKIATLLQISEINQTRQF